VQGKYRPDCGLRIFYDAQKPVGVIFWASASEGRGAARRRHHPHAAAGLEIGRPPVGGRGDRAVRRRRGDGEGPQGEGVSAAGDQAAGGRTEGAWKDSARP